MIARLLKIGFMAFWTVTGCIEIYLMYRWHSFLWMWLLAVSLIMLWVNRFKLWGGACAHIIDSEHGIDDVENGYGTIHCACGKKRVIIKLATK